MRTSYSLFAHVSRILGLAGCLLFGLGVHTLSYAIDRPLPVDAKLGTFSPSAIPTIVIDGNVRLLTAGAQIRDKKNLIVQLVSLGGPDVQILYKESYQGQIDRIWILTRQEVDKYSPGAQPVQAFPGTASATPAN